MAPFRLEPLGDGAFAVIVRHPTARLVEIAGDFTDWHPRALAATGPGAWLLRLLLAPGIHQINVRFDGGSWQVPEGMGETEDGFGGRAGLLVVR
jgi:hypothetical protein